MPDSQSFATSLSHIEHIRQAAARAALSVTPSQEDQTLQQYLHDNKRIIVSVMRRYLGSNPGLDEDDYLQEALPALRKTVEKWDPRRGHKFTTFFYWYLQKQFTACTTEKNFDVLLFDAEGTYLETIPYTTFRKRKRELRQQGITEQYRPREINLAPADR